MSAFAPRVERLTNAVEAAEVAWRRGCLARALASGLAEELGEPIASAYARLVQVPATPGPPRSVLFNDVVARARWLARPPEVQFAATAHPTEDLRPQPRLAGLRAGVRALSRADRSAATTTAGARVRPDLIAREGGVAVRVDQMATLRFWGIGFRLRSPYAEAYDDLLFTHVYTRLHSDLRSLAKIQTRLDLGAEPFEYAVEDVGPRFEQLVLDILNELEPRARRAPLYEDFLEKTDLRVTVDGLQRKRGARIQVTLTVCRVRHAAKVAAVRAAKEFVILSPRTLVRALTSPGAVALSNDERDELWAQLGGRPDDPTTRAFLLRDHLTHALRYATEHPLGPLTSVARPVRAFVRRFVRLEALRSTAELRLRLNDGSATFEEAGAATDAREDRPVRDSPTVDATGSSRRGARVTTA